MLGWFSSNGMGLRWPYLILALLTSVLVIVRHTANIQWLLNREEPMIGKPR
jgi:glycerol-3-phosphate acyltransferase PlsY